MATSLVWEQVLESKNAGWAIAGAAIIGHIVGESAGWIGICGRDGTIKYFPSVGQCISWVAMDVAGGGERSRLCRTRARGCIADVPIQDLQSDGVWRTHDAGTVDGEDSVG